MEIVTKQIDIERQRKIFIIALSLQAILAAGYLFAVIMMSHFGSIASTSTSFDVWDITSIVAIAWGAFAVVSLLLEFILPFWNLKVISSIYIVKIENDNNFWGEFQKNAFSFSMTAYYIIFNLFYAPFWIYYLSCLKHTVRRI